MATLNSICILRKSLAKLRLGPPCPARTAVLGIRALRRGVDEVRRPPQRDGLLVEILLLFHYHFNAMGSISAVFCWGGGRGWVGVLFDGCASKSFLGFLVVGSVV